MADTSDLTPARRAYGEETKPRHVLIHLCAENSEVMSTTNVCEADVREATEQVVAALGEEAKRLFAAAHPNREDQLGEVKYYADESRNGFMDGQALIDCIDAQGFNFEGVCQVFFTIETERPGENSAAVVEEPGSPTNSDTAMNEDAVLGGAVNFLKSALGDGLPFLHALPQLADLLLQLDSQVLQAQHIPISEGCRHELAKLATGDYTGWRKCAYVCAAEYKKLDSFLQEFLVNQVTQAFDVLMDQEKNMQEASSAFDKVKEEPQQPEEIISHPHIICDICDASPLIGFRYKSTVLHDYDVCQNCFDQLIPEQQPYFEKLPKMIDISTPRNNTECSEPEAQPAVESTSDVSSASASSWQNPDGSEKTPSKGTTGSFCTYSSGANDFSKWAEEPPVVKEPTTYEAPDPTLPKHNNFVARAESEDSSPKSVVFLEERAESDSEGSIEIIDSVNDRSEAPTPQDGDFVECAEDDVWSLEDVKTEVSERFCEEDVAIYVVDEDEQLSLGILDDERPMKKMRMIDGYDDEKYEELKNTEIIPHLNTEVISTHAAGNVCPLTPVEWMDFAQKMASIPGPVGSTGCILLGKIGRGGGIITIVLRNNSEIHYPKDTTLKLVCGNGGGFGDLPLAALEPQETVAVSMDFPAGEQWSNDPNGHNASYWILTSESLVFGNLFCVMRE